jgi:hypothetical protein
MSIAGKGVVAIWHDIAAEGRDAFYAWHGREHMPERAAIPGFLRGRRYVALEGEPEYFNLYETASVDVLTGSDYLARLNAPTPWTAETVRHFRNVSRSVCEVAHSEGHGDGGLLATWRYDVPDASAGGHRRDAALRLSAVARHTDIAAAHLLVADTAGSAIETAEKRARADVTLIPRWIVVVESWGDLERFAAFAREFAADPLFKSASAAPAWAVYRLQNTREAPRGG